MAFPRLPSCPRALLRGTRWMLLGALVVGLARPSSADDPPPDPQPAPPLTGPVTDPGGTATAWIAEAEAALAKGHFPAAADAFLRAWERAPDVLVPAPSVVPGSERLSWRVRDVVEVWAGRLPPAARAPLAARRRGEGALRDVARVRGGDEEALRRLCAPPVILDEETEALLVLAEHERERGRVAEALALLERWTRARPEAPPEQRASVAVRRADALAEIGHVAGLRALLAAPEAALETPVARGAETVTVRTRVEEALLSLSPTAPVAPEPVRIPKDLTTLWSLDLSDPALRGDARDPGVVTPGVWATEEVLLVNAGRTVRRVEPLTGRVLWRFPAGPQGWDYDPRAKYAPHDVPLRTVVRAGDLALAVLGDPGGTGAFGHQGADIDIGGTIRESRARLVALDMETGQLRWTTGGARERHPVLSDRGTCCSGPPLVAGERVYVPFGRRFGVVEHYVAALERATGRLEWLSFLGVSESGRDPGSSSARGGRTDRAETRAVPWGATPTLAAGELCVTPHACLAAGLDPETGAVRWVRGLPRYYETRFQTLDMFPMTRGHGGRNAPLAVPGAWVLAPMDCPVMLAVERGTGLLAWTETPPNEGFAATFRDLLGLSVDPLGRPALRMTARSPALVDPFDGRLLSDAQSDGLLGAWWDLDVDVPGRAFDAGGAAVRVGEGELRFAPWPGAVEAALVRVPLPGQVKAGDVNRAGAAWLVVEAERLTAFADREEALAELARVADDAARPPAQRAAARITRARVSGSADGVAEALALAEDDSVRTVAGDALVALLGEQRDAPADTLVAAGPLLDRLSAPARDRAFLARAEGFLAIENEEPRVRVLARWIDAPPGLLRLPLPALQEAFEEEEFAEWRGDLVAASILRRLRREGRGPAALALRDRETAARVDAAIASGDEARLRDEIRRAAATPAATTGRMALAARLAAAGRPGEAAAIAADLRLDPPPAVTGPALKVWCARRQLEEAGWLADAGDIAAARSLLADLLRWVPSGTQDEQGRTTSELAAALKEQTAWGVAPTARPERQLDVWAPVGKAPERDEQSAIAFLGVEGPGAERLGERVVLARGLSLEVWNPVTGERVAVLPGDDEGWFGGTLQDLAPWLPEGGVRVTALVAGQPADTAGVRVGDWITSWNGVPLTGSADFLARIAASTPGRPVAVEVLRQGEVVVATITPGRRPVAEGAGIVDRTHTWSAADGRLLVPSRTGLTWVDPVKAERTPCWRWTGTGTVARVEVFAGTAYALVRRFHDDDLILAVDPATGRERWRTGVSGPVVWMKATGSALHVQVEDTPRVFVLDRHDGSVRAVMPRAEHRGTRRDFRGGDLTLARAETAASAAGRLWVIRGDGFSDNHLAVCNTTTGLVSDVDTGSFPADRERTGGVWTPSVAADAYVAFVASPTRVRLFEPDPVADGVLAATDLRAGDLLTEQLHHGGPLDLDSRVLVGGGTVYVVRNRSSGRGITVMVFARDSAPRPGGPTFLQVDREPPLLVGKADTVLQHLDVTPDGLLLAAMAQQPAPGGEQPRGVLWIPAADGPLEDRASGHRPWESWLLQPRRWPATRAGRWIFVPTDRGADLVPVEVPTPR